VPDKESTWKFAEEFVSESEAIAAARAQSVEFGVETVSPATGAALAVAAASSAARNIIEIGTGVGVSTLWLFAGAPEATVTSIDIEPDFQQTARKSFADAGVPANRVRLITGRTHDVLPRMNEQSYDIVLVDADPLAVIENVEHGLRLVRPGGTVLVPHILGRDRVVDPVRRDDLVTGFRTVLNEIAASDAVLSSVSPVGDGLLQIVKLGS
jgi:predicted O-methyltransferase YrrM